MQTYKVVVKDMEGKVVSVVGTNLTEKQAEKREMTLLSRIDTDNYFVTTEEETK